MEGIWEVFENSAGGGNFRFSDSTELIESFAGDDVTELCGLGVVSSVAIDTMFYVLKKNMPPIPGISGTLTLIGRSGV